MYTDYTEENNNDSYYENQGGSDNKEKLKKIVFFVLIFVILIILIVVIAKGCSKGGSGTSVNNGNNNRIPTVAVSIETLSLKVGDEFQLYADVISSTGNSNGVGWYSEDTSVAIVGDDGLVTAIGEGTTNIVAVYRENGKVYSNKCNVGVSSKVVAIESINIQQENITIKKGDKVLLQISVTPNNAKLTDLVFSSDDPSVASVSQEGYVTGIDIGTTTIYVKTSNDSIEDSITVEVTKTGTTVINPTGLQLFGLSNGVSVGSSARIEYQVLPNSATDKKLIWTSSNPSIAVVNDGIVTGVSAGTCTIMATTSNNISAKLEVTVTANTVPVEGIMINGDAIINLKVHDTRLLSYTISPSNATNKKVYYTSSDSSVVFVNSVGMIAALKAGNAVITITTEDGKKTATVNVNVTGSSGTSQTGNQSSGGSSSGSSSGGSSSGSSSGGSSSGGSSSGGSSSGDNSSTVSGTESSEATCAPYDLVIISHDGVATSTTPRPIISSISFKNAKTFYKTATINIDSIADCIENKKVTYKIYKDTTSNITTENYTIGISSVGSKITLRETGYYKIVVTGTTTSGSTLTKTYYAIVNINALSSGITITFAKNAASTSYNVFLDIKAIDNTGGKISKINYCSTVTTKSDASCTPNITEKYSGMNPSVTFRKPFTISTLTSSQHLFVCAQAYNTAGYYSKTKCYAVK